MKIAVIGIQFSCGDAYTNYYTKTQAIIKLLPQIVKNSEAFSKDATLIIVLHEYALTPTAIQNEQKKEALSALSKAVELYKNVILIPGSFAAYEIISNSNSNEKIKKIAANYSFLSDYHYFQDNQDYFIEKEKFKEQTSGKNMLTRSLCLQNSSYIITQNGKLKHKKSAPFKEKDRLSNSANSFYYIGADRPVKQLKINEDTVEIGLTICCEYYDRDYNGSIFRRNPPLIQAIISDSIRIDRKKLYGALNIHMDSDFGLNVYVNKTHSKVNKIQGLRAVLYSIVGLNKFSCKPANIIHYVAAGEARPSPTKAKI